MVNVGKYTSPMDPSWDMIKKTSAGSLQATIFPVDLQKA